MAGHSFGAHTTLGGGGQSYPGHEGMKESRIAALIALSPSMPAMGDAKRAFSAVTLPTLCITLLRLKQDRGGAFAQRLVCKKDQNGGRFGALPFGLLHHPLLYKL